jgi:4'-phosphopantetheinyl transferase
MRFPKRRADWLLGRWTAKNAFAICFGFPTELQALRDIEICATPSGAPEVFFRNKPRIATISLSHRAGIGACAIAPSNTLLGCDLEVVEPHSNGFAADYFTAEEQALVAKSPGPDRSRLLALLWSTKESALKAVREGLRLDTRSMIVSFPHLPESRSGDTVWSPLQVRSISGQILCGWWSQSGCLLRTVVGNTALAQPILLMRELCLT